MCCPAAAVSRVSHGHTVTQAQTRCAAGPAPESLCWHGSPSPAWAALAGTDWAVQLCHGDPSTSPGQCGLAGCPAVTPPQQLPVPCVTWSSSKATCVAWGTRVGDCGVQGARGLRMDQESQCSPLRVPVCAGSFVQLCSRKLSPEAAGESGLQHTLLSWDISCRSSFSPGAFPSAGGEGSL